MAAGSNDFHVLVANQVSGLNGPMVLRAISCGAVFMGAADLHRQRPQLHGQGHRRASRLPTAFLLRLYPDGEAVLLPVFVLVTILFFLPH